jgi:DNA-binding MarR family transcriptional regulator
MIQRRACEKDRRHVRLSITATGESAVREARGIAQSHVAEALTQLSSEQQETIRSAMEILRSVFTPEASSVDPGGVERVGLEKDCG